MNRNWK